MTKQQEKTQKRFAFLAEKLEKVLGSLAARKLSDTQEIGALKECLNSFKTAANPPQEEQSEQPAESTSQPDTSLNS